MNRKNQKLEIKWQRLIVDEETCERCSNTGDEVKKAYQKLKQTLPSLGIKVELEKEKISKKEFNKNPKASNRIFINNKALEDLIGAKVGESECCDVCGGKKCRTIEVNDNEFEVVPAETIINAALKEITPSQQSCCKTNQEKNCCN